MEFKPDEKRRGKGDLFKCELPLAMTMIEMMNSNGMEFKTTRRETR